MILKRNQKILRILLIATNAIVASVTLLAAYGGVVNPEKTAIPAIISMTFPFWVALCIVSALGQFMFRSKFGLIPIAALLLSIGPILAICPINIYTKATEQEKQTEFSVLSYNLYGFMNAMSTDTAKHKKSYFLDRIAEGYRNPQANYLIHSGANILCLQERTHRNASPYVYLSESQVDSLNNLYPNSSGRSVCIMTAYPMNPIKLRQPAEDCAEFAAAEIDMKGRKLLVIDVHLQSIGLDDGDKELYEEITSGERPESFKAVKSQLLGKLSTAFRLRAAQARLLREQIDSLNYENVIVAGDFNDIPDCYAMRVIAGNDFNNAYTQSAFGPMITYHMNRFYFRIDHVLYRGRIKPISFSRGNIQNSDHYPIETKFVWTD